VPPSSPPPPPTGAALKKSKSTIRRDFARIRRSPSTPAGPAGGSSNAGTVSAGSVPPVVAIADVVSTLTSRLPSPASAPASDSNGTAAALAAAVSSHGATAGLAPNGVAELSKQTVEQVGSATRSVTLSLSSLVLPAEEDEQGPPWPTREGKLAEATLRWRRAAVKVRPSLGGRLTARRRSRSAQVPAGDAPKPSTSLTPEQKRQFKARNDIFLLSHGPLPRRLKPEDELISIDLLRLFLMDAGYQPFQMEEMERLLDMIDPGHTGCVRFAELRKLPCFRPPVLPGEGDASDGRTILYAMVPPGVVGGEVITLESEDGLEADVDVPVGLVEGDHFCYELLRDDNEPPRDNNADADMWHGAGNVLDRTGRAVQGVATNAAGLAKNVSMRVMTATKDSFPFRRRSVDVDDQGSGVASSECAEPELVGLSPSVKLMDVQTRKGGGASPDAIEVQVKPAAAVAPPPLSKLPQPTQHISPRPVVARLQSRTGGDIAPDAIEVQSKPAAAAAAPPPPPPPAQPTQHVSPTLAVARPQPLSRAGSEAGALSRAGTAQKGLVTDGC